MVPQINNEGTPRIPTRSKRALQNNIDNPSPENGENYNALNVEQPISLPQNKSPNYEELTPIPKQNKKQRKLDIIENSNHRDNIFSRLWSWLSEYKGPPSLHLSETPTQDFLNLINIADKTLNPKVLFTTDEFFGATTNLLNPTEPKPIDANEANSQVDAWLTQRRREKGHDWCVIQLPMPAVIYGFEIDLRHLGMEKAPRLSVEGVYCPELNLIAIPKEDEYMKIGSFEYNRHIDKSFDEILKSNGTSWIDLIDSVQACFEDQPKETQPHYFSVVDSQLRVPFTHLRINLFPDGGISRFRAYGQPKLDITHLIDNPPKSLTNVLSYENGACLLTFKDSTLLCGHPKYIISDLFQNRRWETKRSFNRRPIISDNPNLSDVDGDWAIYKLAGRAILESISLNFKGLDGRIPQKLIIQVLDSKTKQFKDYIHEHKSFLNNDHKGSLSWRMLSELIIKDTEIVKSDLKRQHPHWSKRIATHIRLIMIPDGGISNISIMGSLVRPELKE